jgi:hypothetical protein
MKAVEIIKKGHGQEKAAGHLGFAAIRSAWRCFSTGRNSNYCGWLLFPLEVSLALSPAAFRNGGCLDRRR